MAAMLGPQVRREIIRRVGAGQSFRQIRDEVGVSMGVVSKLIRPLGGVIRAEDWQPGSGVRLSLDERVEICIGMRERRSMRMVAAQLGRAPSTISRELAANGGWRRYEPMAAHRRARRCARRPKQTRLDANAQLRAVVSEDLGRWWSPQQISHRLRLAFPDSPEMWLSHETIYKSLYVQGRGELRKELHACLRSGRAVRRKHGREHASNAITAMVMISERPAEIEDRAVPGHWEGDLIIGANNRSQIGTLVERSTRFVMLLHLPKQRTAEAVREAMTAKIMTLPQLLRLSITWDQGREMAQHATFTQATGIPIYFCDPHSPWQRGSNENTNGLLRQYFPKGQSLRKYSQADLDWAADSLNGRPRETLGWKTPAEALKDLLLR